MEVQITQTVHLTDSSSFNSFRLCAWSRNRIDGLNVRIVEPNHNYHIANINIHNIEPLVQALRDHTPSEKQSVHEIGVAVFYFESTSQNGICPICKNEYLGEEVYQIGRVRIHTSCIGELIQLLEEDVWEHSDEILTETLS